MSLVVEVLKDLPTGRELWGVIQRVVPRAFAVTAARMQALAPRGKTRKLSRRVDIRVTPSHAGGIFGGGVQVDFVTGVPYGHLVTEGHDVIARGPTRRQVSITTARISKHTGRQVTTTRFGFDPMSRILLAKRRAAGAIGRVPGNPFAQLALQETRAQAIANVEAGLKQELDR